MENRTWKYLTVIEQINNEIYDDVFEFTRWYHYPIYVMRIILLSLLLLILSLFKLLISIYQVGMAIMYIFFSFTKKVLHLNQKKKMTRTRSFVLGELNNEKNINLILDLDNTLIFSTYKKNDQIKDYTVMDNLYIYKRPYVDKLFNDVSKYCEITIYTSATKDYANPIIDYIDKYKVISKRLFREDCFNINGTYYKDSWKHGFDCKKVIIVDDLPEVHLNSKDNLIPIKRWLGSQNDDSLLKISKTLSNLRYTEDVRGMIKTLININEAQQDIYKK